MARLVDVYGVIVVVNFNLVAWRQERVKTDNEARVTFEQVGHAADDARGVNSV